MAKTSPNRNISRIDIDGAPGTKGTHGYQVRLMRKGKAISKFFSDSAGKGKGKAKALAAARSYRDKMLTKLGPADTGAHTEPSARNTSGVVGVRRREAVRETENYLYYHYFWEASWTDGEGERQKRNYSVNKYGEDEAKDLALASRKKGVAAAKRARKS
jgi:hypothetical protein